MRMRGVVPRRVGWCLVFGREERSVGEEISVEEE